MLEISPVYIALREMTRRNSSNDFTNGRMHSKGRANRQRRVGDAGKGGKREVRRGDTRRIRTISYNHPCLLSFSSILLSLSPRQSDSRYSCGPHAFLYLTIVGQRSTSRAGNGLLTNPWRLLWRGRWTFFDFQGYCRHFTADVVTIKCEIKRNMVRMYIRTYIVGFVNYSISYN